MKKSNTENNQEDIHAYDVRKEAEYKQFALWLSLPSLIKGKGTEEVKMRKQAGFDDPDILELLELETMQEVAKFLDVDKDTLTRWRKKLKASPVFEDIKLWVAGLTKNVVLATYRSAMSKDPKAHLDRKLMLQFAGWAEKLTVDHTAEGLAGIIKGELASFRKEHEQPNTSTTKDSQ